MSTYRVWIHIEEEDPKEDSCTDIDPGFGATGEFTKLSDAELFASALHDFGTRDIHEEEGAEHVQEADPANVQHS